MATRAEPSIEAGGTNAIAKRCAELVSSAGPLGVLRYLNARTRFRFTGLYRAEPPLLRNIHLYDRENPTLNVSGEIARFDETYCAIVCLGDGRPFSTPNAPVDERLTTHAARDCILSYCGVPIRNESGSVWGSLCHFDVRPRLVAPTELDVLMLAASCFVPRLSREPTTT